MKRSSILVNTSRGEVVDENALAAALRDGVIAGAGIDVFEQEPPLQSNPLFSAPNIVLSPHVSGATEASRRRPALEAADAVLSPFTSLRPGSIATPAVGDVRTDARLVAPEPLRLVHSPRSPHESI